MQIQMVKPIGTLAAACRLVGISFAAVLFRKIITPNRHGGVLDRIQKVHKT